VASASSAQLDDLVRWLLSRAQLSQSPPTRLEQLARWLGADVRRTRLRGEDGRVEVRDDKLVILINADRPAPRQRFTLGHEIGHVVTMHPQLQVAPLRRQLGLLDDEAFADAFAESLLMPAWWVRRKYVGRPETLTTLVDFSRASEASLAASAIRLRRVAGWSRSLLCFRRNQQGWTVMSAVGVPRGGRLNLYGTPDTYRLFEDLGRRRARPQDTVVGLHLAGRLREFPAQVHVSGASALVLADLRGQPGHKAPRPTPPPAAAGRRPVPGRRPPATISSSSQQVIDRFRLAFDPQLAANETR
jgi:Zn-dependent peptidase ImmA (M78 family)